MGEIVARPVAVEDQRRDQIGMQRTSGADADIQPPARQNVDGGKILGQPVRALIADRDDRRAELDPAGALGCRRQKGAAPTKYRAPDAAGGPRRCRSPAPRHIRSCCERLLQPRQWIVVRIVAGGQKADMADGYLAAARVITPVMPSAISISAGRADWSPTSAGLPRPDASDRESSRRCRCRSGRWWRRSAHRPDRFPCAW